MSYVNRAPIAEEHAGIALRLTGRIPQGLRGTLFRNGPNPCDPGVQSHWFMGDGMLHAFSIGAGGVTYANRWLRTQTWAQANGLPAAGLPEGLANTSIVPHAGHLLALEEGHMPVAVAPDTLATLGSVDFAGRLPPGPFTAHPKRDPATGALVFFGYGVGDPFEPTLRTGEIAADGTPHRLQTIQAPYAAMVHDFAVTERHIAIPLFPLVFDPAAGNISWQPARGAFLGVMDRAAGAASLRWLPAGPGFAFHMMNAWDDGDALCLDLMLSDAPPLFPDATGRPPADMPATLCRWRANLADPAATVTCEKLSTRDGEFPRIDERFEGRPNRHSYYAAFSGICHRDNHTGQETLYSLPPGDSTSEAVFVARGPAEGDGWLLAVIYRGATARSDLIILDATDIAAGPLATAHLEIRVPNGFHGAWLGAAS